ncbi:electron transfer flavoprotein beta subunit [Hydrogenispora ethanolica]|uniref:Electron transfer flavoprotein small subunit n=1 Tax=Hydrogenispora ethanolica TaxID=1082276 RepID=A0A4R1RFT6_HYDET|nr:electron transfer flavoprotein subunit beta/FixA family protein [Hydrogenispora ethanolica]TCL64786.1 electron transfer flavoprotein beta subunit [Hydrogenispora ethanolica]
MKIVVCVKQVPETTEVKINPETNTLVREGVASIINPFDMYAVEEAIRIKEKLGGTVTVLSMGPPQAAESLRELIGMGADDAILLSDRAFAGSDTLATAHALAKGIAKIGEVGLILCGKQAIDGDTAQVGPEIAENLGIPHLTYVKKVNEIAADHLIAERMNEEGYERVQIPLPALITVVKEINEPRLPSLKGMMRAKKAVITTWTAAMIDADPAKIGLKGSPTWVKRIFIPELKCQGQVFEGTPEEQVQALVDAIVGRKIV